MVQYGIYSGEGPVVSVDMTVSHSVHCYTFFTHFEYILDFFLYTSYLWIFSHPPCLYKLLFPQCGISTLYLILKSSILGNKNRRIVFFQWWRHSFCFCHSRTCMQDEEEDCVFCLVLTTICPRVNQIHQNSRKKTAVNGWRWSLRPGCFTISPSLVHAVHSLTQYVRHTYLWILSKMQDTSEHHTKTPCTFILKATASVWQIKHEQKQHKVKLFITNFIQSVL